MTTTPTRQPLPNRIYARATSVPWVEQFGEIGFADSEAGSHFVRCPTHLDAESGGACDAAGLKRGGSSGAMERLGENAAAAAVVHDRVEAHPVVMMGSRFWALIGKEVISFAPFDQRNGGPRWG